MLKKIDHVGVLTNDYDNTINFYIQYLGFHVLRRTERMTFLQLGESIFEIEPVDPKSYQNTGLNHISLRTDNISEEVQRLETLGIKFYIKPSKDHKFAMFTVPDGVIIELIER